MAFSDLILMPDLQDETVRVSTEGDGEIKILDVKVEKRFSSETRGKKIRARQERLDSLQSHLQTVLDKIAVL